MNIYVCVYIYLYISIYRRGTWPPEWYTLVSKPDRAIRVRIHHELLYLFDKHCAGNLLVM